MRLYPRSVAALVTAVVEEVRLEIRIRRTWRARRREELAEIRRRHDLRTRVRDLSGYDWSDWQLRALDEAMRCDWQLRWPRGQHHGSTAERPQRTPVPEPRLPECPDCGGSGAKETGRTPQGHSPRYELCSTCTGSGEVRG